MKRRQFITACMGLATTTLATNSLFWGQRSREIELTVTAPTAKGIDRPHYFDPSVDREQPVALITAAPENALDARDAHTMAEGSKEAKVLPKVEVTQLPEPNKSIDFARDYDDDIFVALEERALLQSTYQRLQRIQKIIGFGHFNLVTFDEALRYAKRYSAIGEFTPAEMDFIEKLFFTNANYYGFYGNKVSEKLSDQFKKSDVVKIPHSGHYIFKYQALAYYEKIQRDVGDSIILTSGIRSNIKQLYLFLAKTIKVKGNLSRASRSLAPPGYSYHGVGDFDVGRVGWGAKNFTDDFATTDEFKKMQDLGYIAIRYDHGNKLGVRFEPWHIKVV